MQKLFIFNFNKFLITKFLILDIKTEIYMDDSYYIKKCKVEIEKRLNWQGSDKWKNRDYENLSETIFHSTEILISVSTLKRLWKNDYEGLPQTNTLNALAIYIGYKNWADFKSSISKCNEATNFYNSTENPPKIKKLTRLITIIFLLIISISLFFIFNPTENHKITLSIKTSIEKGAPNTVIFNYKIENFKDDNYYFQPSWNELERQKINNNGETFTAIYYYPGYHTAKILNNSNILKSINIKINTDNWLVCVRNKPTDVIPIYINSNEIFTQNYLGVRTDLLIKTNNELKFQPYWTSYFNVKDFSKINGNNFVFESEIANPSVFVCQSLYIYLMFESGYLVVPFGNKGCSNKFAITLFDKYISGKDNDLSAFGCDLSDWNKIKIVSANKNVSFFINDINIYKNKFSIDAGKLQGIHYMFYGNGKIKNYKFSNENNKVEYSEEFN